MSSLSVFTLVGSAARPHTCGARRQGGALGGNLRRHIGPTHLCAGTAWSSSAYRLVSPEGVETSHWGNAPRRARRLNPALCLRLAAITLHDSTALGSQRPCQRQTAYPAETTSQQVAPHLCSARRGSTALHRGVNAQFHLAVHPRACRPAWPIAVVSTAERVYDGAQRAFLSSV